MPSRGFDANWPGVYDGVSLSTCLDTHRLCLIAALAAGCSLGASKLRTLPDGAIEYPAVPDAPFATGGSGGSAASAFDAPTAAGGVDGSAGRSTVGEEIRAAAASVVARAESGQYRHLRYGQPRRTVGDLWKRNCGAAVCTSTSCGYLLTSAAHSSIAAMELRRELMLRQK